MIKKYIYNNIIFIFIFLFLRKIFSFFFRHKGFSKKDKIINSPEQISKIISNYIKSNKPFFVGRLGAHEINIIENYFGTKKKKISLIKFLLRKNPEWFWHKRKMKYFKNNAGFFPLKEEYLKKYSVDTLNCFKQVDLHGFTQTTYSIYKSIGNHYKFKKVIKCNLKYLEPYLSKNPWSRFLKNKTVLVIHPFSKSIESQYKNKRKVIFSDQGVLPKFKLKTIKSIQLIGDKDEKFKNWFEALEHMKRKIDQTKFDIAIIGCGAYGFNLGAYIKQKGKSAIHLGGSTQILFGIKGRRFENPRHYNGFYLKLFNNAWVRPHLKEKPTGFSKIENGAYW